MAQADSQARRRQAVAGILVALGCWVLLAALQWLGLFRAFEPALLDWRYRLRGERPAAKSIALVAIDDATIRAYGRWPIPRDQYALLLIAIAEGGARATGVDLQFPADRNQDPKSDALLAYVVSQQDRLVLATWFHADADSAPGQEAPGPEVLAAVERQGIAARDVAAAVATSIGLPYSELALAARQLGHITVAPDRDGAIRREPAVVRYGDRLYASLAVRTAGAAQGHIAPPAARMAGGALRLSWDGGPAWSLQLDDDGTTPIDFAGDRASFPRSYSMLDVLRWFRDGDTARLRDAFRDRIVLIGLDSRKEVAEDVGATPFSAATPLLFVHANFLDNLLQNRFLHRVPAGIYFAALAFLAILLGWALGTRPLPLASLVAAAALVAIVALDFALFAVWALDAPPVAALLLAPVSYGGVASFRYIFLERRAIRREEEIREGRGVQQQFLPEALVGQRLSRYEIVEKIGAGGMGVVYRGYDPRLGRDVAVKVLPGRALSDEKARRRFRTEAHALSRLTHPHIAGIYDFDTQDGTDFIVMEYVPGQSLAARIHKGRQSEADAADIAAQIAEALAEAHARGIVHRDLKPDNVKLNDRGEVKILDFGLARVASEVATSSETTVTQSLTEQGHLIGTPPYMAPEVLRGERAGPAADLYALGVILFEMLAGRRPFPDDEPHELMYTVLNQPPPSLRVVNTKVSESMEKLVLHALQKSPASRIASAEEFLRRLGPRARAATSEAP